MKSAIVIRANERVSMNQSKSETNSKFANPGNQFGVKLKDPAIRQKAFKQYCAHLATGYPRECFHFDHPTHSVCWKTMERYIEQDEVGEFPLHLLERAKAARFKHWFDEGRTLMKGGYKGGSPVVWQTIMRNVCKDVGWDREQMQVAADGLPAIHPSSINSSRELVSEATIRASENLRMRGGEMHSELLIGKN